MWERGHQDGDPDLVGEHAAVVCWMAEKSLWYLPCHRTCWKSASEVPEEAVLRWRATLQKFPQSHLKRCQEIWHHREVCHLWQSTAKPPKGMLGKPIALGPLSHHSLQEPGTGESDCDIVSGCWRSCVCLGLDGGEIVSCSIFRSEAHHIRRRNFFLSCLSSTCWQNLA